MKTARIQQRRAARNLRVAFAAMLLLSSLLVSMGAPSTAQAVSAPTTILIMGVNPTVDSAIDVGTRPIALSVMHVDPATGACSTLSIPSDSLAELPGYGETKIRHALLVGGIPFQQLVTETYLGIDIDHYVLVDFDGFEQLVDAVGGVTLTIPQELAIADLPAGTQTLNGSQALTYARVQDAGGDFARIQRQQALIQAIIESLNGLDLVTEANQVVSAVEDNVRTDFSLQQLADMGDFFKANCSGDGMFMDSIPGETVYGPIIDPLFDIPLSYVVSDPAVVQSKVESLISPNSGA